MATITKRVGKEGKLSYLIKVSLGYDEFGKQKTKSMTYKPEVGMSERSAYSEAKRQAVFFEDKCKEQETSDERIKFRYLADEWIDLMQKTREMKPTTLTRMKKCKERTYKALGDIYVDKITYRQIQKFVLSLAEDGVNKKTGKGLSQKTQKHYITFVSDVLKYAVKCDYIADNPCKDISTVKTQTKEKEIYSIEELQTLLKLINEEAPIEYKVFFNILAYNGIRRSEAMGMEYKDVDFENNTIMIQRASNYSPDRGVYTDTLKTKSSCRQLKVRPFIIELIKQLQEEHKGLSYKLGDLWVENDRLFITWCGAPMHPNTPYTWLKRFCKRNGLKFKGLHSFRHSVATQAIANGEDIKTVSAILGHSQTSTTINIYAHTLEKATVRAFDKMADLLEN